MKSLVRLFFVLLFTTSLYAQHVTHDLGVFFGNTTIFTDYGQRGDFQSSLEGATGSFAVAHYMHFFNNNSRWNSSGAILTNLMVKTELNFYSANLEHQGKWAEGTSEGALQLQAMKGSVSVVNIGMQLEYYFRDLGSFVAPFSRMKFNPFVTFGINYALYNNTLTSDLGDWQTDISVLPFKYRSPEALNIGSGGAMNYNVGAGTRFKLTKRIDLAAQMQIQMYLTDEIDGLQPNVIENRNNDFVTILQVGVIYHLNFNQPLLRFF